MNTLIKPKITKKYAILFISFMCQFVNLRIQAAQQHNSYVEKKYHAEIKQMSVEEIISKIKPLAKTTTFGQIHHRATFLLSLIRPIQERITKQLIFLQKNPLLLTYFDSICCKNFEVANILKISGAHKCSGVCCSCYSCCFEEPSTHNCTSIARTLWLVQHDLNNMENKLQWAIVSALNGNVAGTNQVLRSLKSIPPYFFYNHSFWSALEKAALRGHFNLLQAQYPNFVFTDEHLQSFMSLGHFLRTHDVTKDIPVEFVLYFTFDYTVHIHSQHIPANDARRKEGHVPMLLWDLCKSIISPHTDPAERKMYWLLANCIFCRPEYTTLTFPHRLKLLHLLCKWIENGN